MKNTLSHEVKRIRAEIRDTRRVMKDVGIRRISCFNGGLSSAEYAYNSRLFHLSCELEKAEKVYAETH